MRDHYSINASHEHKLANRGKEDTEASVLRVSVFSVVERFQSGAELQSAGEFRQNA